MSSAHRFDEKFIPALAGDFIRVDIDGEAIVWSDFRPVPTLLDPVAAVMLGVFDGSASVADLAHDVHQEVGVPIDVARSQVDRIITLFDRAGLLVTSERRDSATDAMRNRRLFVHPTSY